MEVFETGKLSSHYLAKLLGRIEINDERVVVGPGIGEDAAVVDMGNRYLIVKSDPITFVAERIGWYVVHINANDIAAMGGVPRWFLVTMLLPEGKTNRKLIEGIMDDLNESCKELGITLVGGHTEITPGLRNPILAGTMLGETTRDRLIRNGSIAEGDFLYIVKGIAIEATSVIARDRREDVIRRFGERFYKRCVNFIVDPGISIVEDAVKVHENLKVSGMHDPTEGGVLNGGYEMAVGSGVGLELYLDEIPVYPETKALCDFFKISPYSSLASGALLVAVNPGDAERLELLFSKDGEFGVKRIGRFLKKGERMYVVRNGIRTPVEPSGKDEVTKIIK